MPRRRIKRRAEPSAGRPSIFFIVALALGVILLIWVAYQAITHPMTPPKKQSLLPAGDGVAERRMSGAPLTRPSANLSRRERADGVTSAPA